MIDGNKSDRLMNLWDIGQTFFKMGLTAFGGPAAHTAMMHEKLVIEKEWVDEKTFLGLVSAGHLIPGPNSTELAIHLGYVRGGVLGLIVAGVAFIFPAMIIVLGFAMFYKAYGTIPTVENILKGIKAVVVVIVLQAVIKLGTKTLSETSAWIFMGTSLGMIALGIPEIIILVIMGLLAFVSKKISRHKLHSLGAFIIFGAVTDIKRSSESIQSLFLSFLKIGSVLYGSGYVLLAFLETEFVSKGVLSYQQLLDAVSVGQFTPGPVFTTATFIGYLLHGTSGAIVSTIGIFLPSFILILLIAPYFNKLLESQWIASILDGVNIASLALMASVSLTLGMNAIVDIPTGIIAVVSGLLLWKTKINPTVIIFLAGLIGWFIF